MKVDDGGRHDEIRWGDSRGHRLRMHFGVIFISRMVFLQGNPNCASDVGTVLNSRQRYVSVFISHAEFITVKVHLSVPL